MTDGLGNCYHLEHLYGNLEWLVEWEQNIHRISLRRYVVGMCPSGAQ